MNDAYSACTHGERPHGGGLLSVGHGHELVPLMPPPSLCVHSDDLWSRPEVAELDSLRSARSRSAMAERPPALDGWAQSQHVGGLPTPPAGPKPERPRSGGS